MTELDEQIEVKEKELEECRRKVWEKEEKREKDDAER